MIFMESTTFDDIIKDIIKKNNLLLEKVKATNDSYKSLITLTNNFGGNDSEGNELSYTIGSLLKKDNELITKIIPIKYDGIDSQLNDEYIFIGSYVYSQYYLSNIMALQIKNPYVGKWMIFGTLDEMINYWKIIRTQTFMNNLGFFSKFTGDEKNRVICIYFEDYRDKENIMNYGKIIKDMIDYQSPMYFKTNRMTINKKYGVGAWKYMIKGGDYEFINK